MRKIFIASVALALMGSDCGSTKDHTGHTGHVDSGEGAYTGPTEFQSAQWDCDETDNAYWYNVYTVGWIAEVRLYISQTGVGVNDRWDELGHVFPPTETFDNATDESTLGYYDPNGWWDNPYMELADTNDPNNGVVYGSTSLYDCNAARYNTLTWAVEVDDVSGSYIGCYAWGEDTGNTDDYDFNACTPV